MRSFQRHWALCPALHFTVSVELITLLLKARMSFCTSKPCISWFFEDHLRERATSSSSAELASAVDIQPDLEDREQGLAEDVEHHPEPDIPEERRVRARRDYGHRYDAAEYELPVQPREGNTKEPRR